MGKENKTTVQLIISHLEGCSGNFLGRLYADTGLENQQFFRVDHNLNDKVLGIDGRQTWHKEIEDRLENHSVIVCHTYNRSQIVDTFPSAKLIQIYPYTHIGNVLYNICQKKLKIKLKNSIDNHFIDISQWFNSIEQQRPQEKCFDFWDLTDKSKVENILDIKLNPEQTTFLEKYWQEQLLLDLNIPTNRMNIQELIDFWQIEKYFDSWMIAWTIFVFEKINNLNENDRTWTIDDLVNCKTWGKLLK